MGCDHKKTGILWDDADAFCIVRTGADGIADLRDFGGGTDVAVSTERQKGV
jgi:hypothetical protein